MYKFIENIHLCADERGRRTELMILVLEVVLRRPLVQPEETVHAQVGVGVGGRALLVQPEQTVHAQVGVRVGRRGRSLVQPEEAVHAQVVVAAAFALRACSTEVTITSSTTCSNRSGYCAALT